MSTEIRVLFNDEEFELMMKAVKLLKSNVKHKLKMNGRNLSAKGFDTRNKYLNQIEMLQCIHDKLLEESI